MKCLASREDVSINRLAAIAQSVTASSNQQQQQEGSNRGGVADKVKVVAWEAKPLVVTALEAMCELQQQGRCYVGSGRNSRVGRSCLGGGNCNNGYGSGGGVSDSGCFRAKRWKIGQRMRHLLSCW